MDAFRTKKETIKATYTAAQAQTRINEAFSGISEEMGDVGLAIQRAEDKTEQMQARAGAIDELMASGALDDPTAARQGRHPGRAGPAGRRLTASSRTPADEGRAGGRQRAAADRGLAAQAARAAGSAAAPASSQGAARLGEAS